MSMHLLKVVGKDGVDRGIVMKADFEPKVGDIVEVTSTYPMKVVGIIKDEEEKTKYKDMPVWVEKTRQK